MQDLRLLGVSEDGTRFVLQAPDGQTYGLRLDERLHAALRGDRARLGQLQIQIDQELRPREIQARIRAGESAEDIASASGVPAEHVRRFEGPVLLERTVVAESARATQVRRVTDAAATPLGALVAERLQSHGVSSDELSWDSWRRDDGKWLVRLSYAQAGRDHHATWLFDAAVHTIEPFDDEADWLTDEERAVPEHREPKPFVPRLASVPPVSELLTGPPQEAPADDEPDADAISWDAPDVDLTSVPAPVRAPRGHDPSWIPGFGVDEEPPAPEPVRPKGRHKRTPTRASSNANGSNAAGSGATNANGATDKAAERDGVAPGKRATVPSWDEILFGTSKPED